MHNLCINTWQNLFFFGIIKWKFSDYIDIFELFVEFVRDSNQTNSKTNKLVFFFSEKIANNYFLISQISNYPLSNQIQQKDSDLHLPKIAIQAKTIYCDTVHNFKTLSNYQKNNFIQFIPHFLCNFCGSQGSLIRGKGLFKIIL